MVRTATGNNCVILFLMKTYLFMSVRIITGDT